MKYDKDFSAFINAIAQAAVTGKSSVSEAEMRRYLALLATLHTDGVRSGGLIVKMSPDGTLHYADLVSVTELYLSREKIIAQRMALAVIREQERQKALQMERGGHER